MDMYKGFEVARNAHPGWRQSLAHAEHALPVLVYYATVLKQPITYTELAGLLRTSRRSLGRPLYIVGTELQRLAARWRQRIPHIQFLVHRQGSPLPGKGGLDWLLKEVYRAKKVPNLSKPDQVEAVEWYWNRIWKYHRWSDVLQALNLKPYKPQVPSIASVSSRVGKRYGHGKGESLDHLRLKYYVSQHPAKIGFPSGTKLEAVEYLYPSADRADVMFKSGNLRVAAEVKPKSADMDELIRGMYQCMKYRALSRAQRVWEGVKPSVDSVLVFEGRLPPNLLPMKKAFELEVIEGVKTPSTFKLPPGIRPRVGSPDEQD